MAKRKFYEDYFAIDPKYYAAVTADLIESGKVSWKRFYPHETFLKLLEKTHAVLSGQDPRSLWVEGAYGTGKSHAALTVKSMLEATDEELRAYFEEYGLSRDLCRKLIADKNDGLLLTIHRIGSSSIRSDRDLILAVQESITEALKAHGIENRGEVSLRDAALDWLSDKLNRDYFNGLIQKEKYAWTFGGSTVEEVIDRLRDGSPAQIEKTMRDILTVAEDNGITALRLDIEGLAAWIKDILEQNDIKAILFVWDEFTEFFQNNPNSLTGFQTLAEISQSHPFYFMIVSHVSEGLFVNRETRKKILDRFVPPIRIELPDNMAFKLMAQAMKTTADPVLKKEWEIRRPELVEDLDEVCTEITRQVRGSAAPDRKNDLSKEELLAIVPIHPYAALLLKHLSVAFSSNQRSMFDFIISNDRTDAKGFKWFIHEYGPSSTPNLLTVDLLWDFFYGKGQNGLDEEVRVVLDSYYLLNTQKMSPDEISVLKTVLLLQALSLRVGDNDLLKPNERNVDLAYSGVAGWSKGKAQAAAERLVKDGILFKRNVGGGKYEYMMANTSGDASTINSLKEKISKETRTQDLILRGELLEALSLPAPIRGRFVFRGSSDAGFKREYSRLISSIPRESFPVLVTFALDSGEAGKVKSQILQTVQSDRHGVIFIDAGLSPMERELADQYVENMAYSRYYTGSNKGQAEGYERQAMACLNEWKNKISSGAFMIYSAQIPNGRRVPNLMALQEEFAALNHERYPYGLENFDVKGDLFAGTALALGAECGMTQKLRQTYKEPKLETALAGAWGVDKYWEDPTKKNLPIVRMKKKVEEVVQEGFASAACQVAVADVYDVLEDAPFGFRASNLAAFVMGFLLKEYASPDYFWSNGSKSENMSTDKMKMSIANAIKQTVSPDRKYKPDYIVLMSPEQRAFLECTAEVFDIPPSHCGSVEDARAQIRIHMKNLSFPIWTVKSILQEAATPARREVLAAVIDDYTGIMNTGNRGPDSENELAHAIGRAVRQDPGLPGELADLLTDANCRKGMMAYLASYRDGILRDMAAEVGDGGAYLERVKKKFSADEANWVWNVDTANEKIDDVILEYRIMAESTKSLPDCRTWRAAVSGWKSRTENIRISCEAMKKVAGSLGPFLEELCRLSRTGELPNGRRARFYELLTESREDFEVFYRDQLPTFRAVAELFLDDLEEGEVADLFEQIPTGQFTKSSTEYMNTVEKSVKDFTNRQAKKKLRDLWKEKTGTTDPRTWSECYDTPILCMVNDDERAEAQEAFTVLLENAPAEAAVDRALKYLERVDYYDRLANPEERDRCFMERVVGDYAWMVDDPQAVREELSHHCSVGQYDWMDNSAVHRQIERMAERKYRTGGSEKVWEVVEKMDADELRHYLKGLIADNVTVGIEILKNQ